MLNNQVVPPERLVWSIHGRRDLEHRGQSDVAGLSTVTFAPTGAQTEMRLTRVPHKARAAETRCFAVAIAGLDKEWTGGMGMLAEFLAELPTRANTRTARKKAAPVRAARSHSGKASDQP